MKRSELNKLKEIEHNKMLCRLEKKHNGYKHILVCGGTGCVSNHSEAIINELHRQINEKKISNVEVIKTGCFGLCAKGPVIIIKPNNTFYQMAKVEDISEIITEDIIGNRIVERLLCKNIDNSLIEKLDDLPFYKKQKRIVLRNCGVIDPENIYEYIAQDGYQALSKVLFEMTPLEVIEEIKKANLRGRGGAGFKTGLKWELGYKEKSKVKYVACNADEGDPGAFMDRSILEGDPHSIIEAMIIAGYAIGVTHGFIYIRSEYPIAVTRLKHALEQARKNNLLGDNILETDFSFDLEIRLGAGAFVCGEETALMQSVEGKRGEPILRPPYPTTKGIYGCPTVLNNVETYANITAIILNGAEWFSKIGLPNSTGTKVFALGGKVNNTGLIEVPMGTTLREIIYDIGGGIPNQKEFKMAQTGGPSGGCIPKEMLDVKMDYDSLISLGTMMGSGGLIIMDEDTCAVDIAKYFLDFTVDESCGKCSPCRIGNKRLYEMLINITSGKGKQGDLEKLEELANYIKENSLCGLGQSSPNPILSTLRWFRSEYEDHLKGHCKSGICKDLINYEILPDKCIGCGLCRRNCPVMAIKGDIKTQHVIDQTKCIKCGLCYQNCRFKAVVRK